jgi:hypothetical protein
MLQLQPESYLPLNHRTPNPTGQGSVQPGTPPSSLSAAGAFFPVNSRGYPVAAAPAPPEACAPRLAPSSPPASSSSPPWPRLGRRPSRSRVRSRSSLLDVQPSLPHELGVRAGCSPRAEFEASREASALSTREACAAPSDKTWRSPLPSRARRLSSFSRKLLFELGDEFYAQA